MTRGLVMGSKQGAKPTQTGQAFMDIADILSQLRARGLDETGKKLDEIDAKFQKLTNAAQVAGRTLMAAGKMSQASYDALLKSIKDAQEAESNSTVADANAKVREENQKKAQAAFAEGQRIFSQMVAEEDKKLDIALTDSAAKQGKTREQIYEQEYEAWAEQKTRQLFAGEITGTQYDEFMKQASTKRLIAAQAEAKEIQALRNNLALAGTSDLKRQELEINQRYDAEIVAAKKLNVSLAEQLKLINEINAARTKDLGKTQQDAGLKNEAQRYQSMYMLFAQLMGKKQNLSQEEAASEDRIDAEREQAVRTMFSNMGEAAREFGATGFAVYKGFAIAQATIDTAKAAIAAYQSVVGIPYVGPVLAPIAAAAAAAAGAAQIASIESASPREFGGPVEAGKSYIVGERRPELFVPDVPGYIHPSVRNVNLSDRAGGRQRSSDQKINVMVHFNDDPRRTEKDVRDNPNIHHIIVDVARRNAQYIQRHA